MSCVDSGLLIVVHLSSIAVLKQLTERRMGE
jgi:hypothetical protein